VYPAVLLIYLIYAAVIRLLSLALIVQVSLPYNKTGRTSVHSWFVRYKQETGLMPTIEPRSPGSQPAV